MKIRFNVASPKGDLSEDEGEKIVIGENPWLLYDKKKMISTFVYHCSVKSVSMNAKRMSMTLINLFFWSKSHPLSRTTYLWPCILESVSFSP